jgi:hypothetical protein
MKKFLIGLLVGIALSFSSVAFANNEEVKGIFASFRILINGKEIQLEQQPLVIDGSTYLPLRKISELFGYEVQYEDSTRTISLSNDGKKYLSNLDKEEYSNLQSQDQPTNHFVLDLKNKYSSNGKLNLDLIKEGIEKKELTLNSQDEETGDSLLILSIRENNYQVFNYLATNGANLELPNKNGETPLHIATFIKSGFYMSELLTTYRVNPEIKDNNNKRPIDYVDQKSDEYRLLRAYSR